MLDRFNPVLRVLCLLLAGLVLYQVSTIAARKDSAEDLSVAAVESILDVAEAPAKTAGTNTVRASTATAGKELEPRPAELPPAIQARVDRITQSEILGPVLRPLPMALFGIAGKDVLLRTATGQTGLLREGEELGGVKLLRIGTNRVLIEHERQQKELTVFSGVGGETLLPKAKEEKKTE